MRKVVSFDKELEFKTMIGEITSISLDQNLLFEDDSTVSGELIVSGKYKLTAASRLEEDFSFHLPMEIVLTERLDSETRNVNIEDFRYEVEDNDILLCHIDLLVEGVEIIDDVESDCEDIRESSDTVSIEATDDNPSVEEIKTVQTSDIAAPIDISTSPEIVSPRQEVVSNDSANFSNALDKPVDVDVNVNVNTNSNSNINSNINTIDSTVEVDNTVVNDSDDVHDGVGSLFSSFKDSDETFATYSVYIFRANDTIEMIMDKYQVTKEELENYNDLSTLTIGSKVIIPTQIHE